MPNTIALLVDQQRQFAELGSSWNNALRSGGSGAWSRNGILLRCAPIQDIFLAVMISFVSVVKSR